MKFINIVKLSAKIILLLAVFAGCKNGAESYNGEQKGTQMKQKPPIEDVIRAHSDELMAIDGVNGVYSGKLEDGSDCIKVMVVKKTREHDSKIPKELEGYTVMVEEVGEIKPLSK